DVGPIRARKIGLVAARLAMTPERIETRWNGKESEIVAEPGDWVATSLSPTGESLRDTEGHLNIYAIKAGRFSDLYEPAEIAQPPSSGASKSGAVFRPKG